MKSIHDQLANGNKAAAIEALYKLPLRDYPRLIHYCVENPDFGKWVSIQLELILDDNSIQLNVGNDKKQFRCVEEARGAMLGDKPVAAMLKLTYGAKKQTCRLIRRSVRISGQMLMNHGLAGMDTLVRACNIGLEDD